MEKMNGIVKLVEKLRLIAWDWNKSQIDTIAAQLGLIEPTTGSDSWIGYRSSDPTFPSSFTGVPYGFSLRGQQVCHFQITINDFDMADVYENENDQYDEVYEQKQAEFIANFKYAVKHITKLLGKPIFKGGPDDDGSIVADPIVWQAIVVAAWRVKNGRLILVCEHQDELHPITLDLYVCPPKEDKQ